MSDSVEFLRRVLAVFLWLTASIVIFYYILKSLQLAFRAARREATFRARERLPVKYSVFLTLGIILAIIGTVLWAPQLISLVPCGVVVALLIGVSAWINLRIRQYFAQRRKPESRDS